MRRGLIKPEGLQKAKKGFFLGRVKQSRVILSYLTEPYLGHSFFRREAKDTHKRCVKIPSPSVGVIEKPTPSSMSLHLKWKISFINERSRSKMYQRYIFLQEEGGPSVWISTQMVHRRMEMRIDQINISI